jgi:hypothetical protein
MTGETNYILSSNRCLGITCLNDDQCQSCTRCCDGDECEGLPRQCILGGRPKPDPENDNTDGGKTGLIVGLSIVSVLLFAVIVAFGIYYYRTKKQGR